MSTKTSLVARQYRLQEWATQIQDCKNRPSDMTVAQWCDQHDITTANYYYRQGEVRKALLSSVGQPSEEQSGQRIPFVDISDAAAIPDASHDKKASGPTAVIHCGPFRVELFDPADPGFIRSVLEALKHAQ